VLHTASSDAHPLTQEVPVAAAIWDLLGAEIPTLAATAAHAASDYARAALERWLERVQARTESDFIPWATNYWTHQWLALKLAWYHATTALTSRRQWLGSPTICTTVTIPRCSSRWRGRSTRCRSWIKRVNCMLQRWPQVSTNFGTPGGPASSVRHLAQWISGHLLAAGRLAQRSGRGGDCHAPRSLSGAHREPSSRGRRNWLCGRPRGAAVGSAAHRRAAVPHAGRARRCRGVVCAGRRARRAARALVSRHGMPPPMSRSGRRSRPPFVRTLMPRCEGRSGAC